MSLLLHGIRCNTIYPRIPFYLSLDFEHRQHISIIKLETWSKRHATKIRGWRDSKEGATILLIGTLARVCITIASFSLGRPLLTILSRNQTKRCAIRRILLKNSRSKITMGAYPFSRQDIHNGGRIRRWTGDGQKVVNSVPIGIW